MSDPILAHLLSFLADSPSPFHAAALAARMLEAHGFSRVDERAEPAPIAAGDRGYVLRDASLVAFRAGSAPVAEAGFRIACAHTDCPGLRVKPRATTWDRGYARLGVEVYGGPILATWVDRDLGLAGRIVARDGSGTREVLVDVPRPVCRIPTLAIHMQRDVNEEGLKLNAQNHLPLVLGLGEASDADPFAELLANAADCAPADLLAWDVGPYDLAGPCLAGLHDEFVLSRAIDDLACCHAALEGLFAAGEEALPPHTAILALFDHEEVGSETSRGARSTLLRSVLERLVEHARPAASGGLSRAAANSFLISADMAHAVHPAYADRHDPEHLPRLNGGPVIKQNASHRYTTEAASAAFFLRLCECAGSPVQWYVARSDTRAGSTVGPMVASSLGIPSVDVGNPMLSMHSIREMAGAADHAHLARVFGVFFGRRAYSEGGASVPSAASSS